jgi:hypothetical protein
VQKSGNGDRQDDGGSGSCPMKTGPMQDFAVVAYDTFQASGVHIRRMASTLIVGNAKSDRAFCMNENASRPGQKPELNGSQDIPKPVGFDTIEFPRSVRC